MWTTSCTGSVRGGFWGFEKSQSWVPAAEGDGWLSGLAKALRRVPHVVWGRWKSQHRKIVYLPPHVEKPFNSKVIKSFVPELRSRKCFLCFGIPMLSICALWMFCVPVWICLFLKCIVRVLTPMPIVSKLLVMSFKTTEFILTLQQSFWAVLGDNLGFLSCPGKFYVVLNCLNFLITDCTVDLGIANRFEIVL